MSGEQLYREDVYDDVKLNSQDVEFLARYSRQLTEDYGRRIGFRSAARSEIDADALKEFSESPEDERKH